MPDRNRPGLSAEADSPVFLSERQREALALAAQGCANKDSALRMEISPRTVRKHLATGRATLGAVNTTHAVAIAVGLGLIKLEGDRYVCLSRLRSCWSLVGRRAG